MTRTLAAKVVEGLHNQGWEIIGYGGTWAGAMRPLEEYVKRKVERAVQAERDRTKRLVEDMQAELYQRRMTARNT